MVNVLLGSDIAGRHKAIFGYHPLVLILTLSVTIITIWISAWLPARKLSKLTPLEAIRNSGELQLKRKKTPVYSRFFRCGGRTGWQCIKSTEKSPADSIFITCNFIYGFCGHGVFLFSFLQLVQGKPILRGIRGMGCDGYS